MIAELRRSSGTDGPSSRKSVAEDEFESVLSYPKKDAFCAMITLMAEFGVMVWLNVYGEFRIEVFFQIPISVKSTADSACK